MGQKIFYLDERDASCRRMAFLIRLAGYDCSSFSHRDEFQNSVATHLKSGEPIDLLIIGYLDGNITSSLFDFIQKISKKRAVVVLVPSSEDEGSAVNINKLVGIPGVTCSPQSKIRDVLSSKLN